MEPLLRFKGVKCNNSSENFKNFVRNSDPWKIIFAVKMGLALSTVSFLIIYKEMKDISHYSIWAILTVILMLEYTIGATFIKGFNQLLGTLCSAILAFGLAELSLMVGREEVLIVCSIFITGFFASCLKLYATTKPYEYGFRVFMLTYCILMVAGKGTSEYSSEEVVDRLVLIAFGATVCLAVNVCTYFIWSGYALRNLVVKNSMNVANSLEGCVNEYLKLGENERFSPKMLKYQAYDDPVYAGYRSAVEFTSKELAFAMWEPAYGRFKMLNYPWRNYVEICRALRHCAFMVMALHGCILSEIQAPAAKQQVFQSELQKVGAEAAKVLRELGNKLEKTEKSGSEDILKEVNKAAEKLQIKIDEMSCLPIKSESLEIIARNPIELQHSDTMKLEFNCSETVVDLTSVITSSCSSKKELRKCRCASATFATLLIQCVSRLQGVVEACKELSERAEFMEPT